MVSKSGGLESHGMKRKKNKRQKMMVDERGIHTVYRREIVVIIKDKTINDLVPSQADRPDLVNPAFLRRISQ